MHPPGAVMPLPGAVMPLSGAVMPLPGAVMPLACTGSSLALTCHKCKGKLEKLPGKPLLSGTTWRWLQCRHHDCRQGASAAKWLCQCGKLWYTCDEPAPSGHATGLSAATGQPRRMAMRRQRAHTSTQPPIDYGVHEQGLKRLTTSKATSQLRLAAVTRLREAHASPL